jgi:spoIIIJ-associated protein
MSEKKGIFGFFKGWASVSEEEKNQRCHAVSQTQGTAVKAEPTDAEITEEMELFCVERLEECLEKAGFSGKVKVTRKEGTRLYLDIFDTGSDVSRIIGKSGATLESFQILLRHFMIRKFQAYIYIVIDVDAYRERRNATIKSMALDAASTLSASGESIKLEEMTSSERSVIHMLFENDESIITESEGRGRRRCIILIKK